MIFQLLRRNPRPETIHALYGAIVAQARLPAFYRRYGVTDTVAGRFDMIVLHVVLFFRRVRGERAAVCALGQHVFDRFCRDMDHNLREMGVGDLAIPKRMQRVGEAFYGRAQSYDQALAASDEAALASALAKNVFASPAELSAGAASLAIYTRAAEKHLAAQSGAAFVRGELDFPDPDTIFPAAGEAVSEVQ